MDSEDFFENSQPLDADNDVAEREVDLPYSLAVTRRQAYDMIRQSRTEEEGAVEILQALPVFRVCNLPTALVQQWDHLVSTTRLKAWKLRKL